MGLIILQEKIKHQKLADAEWYKKDFHEEIPVPILGPDLIDPRKYQLIREQSEKLTVKEAEESNSKDEVSS